MGVRLSGYCSEIILSMYFIFAAHSSLKLCDVRCAGASDCDVIYVPRDWNWEMHSFEVVYLCMYIERYFRIQGFGRIRENVCAWIEKYDSYISAVFIVLNLWSFFSPQTNLPVFKVKDSTVRRRYSDFEWLRNELERDSKVSHQQEYRDKK